MGELLNYLTGIPRDKIYSGTMVTTVELRNTLFILIIQVIIMPYTIIK